MSLAHAAIRQGAGTPRATAGMHVSDTYHVLLDAQPLPQNLHDERDAFFASARSARTQKDAAVAAIARDPNLSAEGKWKHVESVANKFEAEIAGLAATADEKASRAAALRDAVEGGRLTPLDGGGFAKVFDPEQQPGGMIGTMMRQGEVRQVVRGMSGERAEAFYHDAVSRGDHLATQAIEDSPAGALISDAAIDIAKQKRFDASPHKALVEGHEAVATACKSVVGDMKRELAELRQQRRFNTMATGTVI